MKTIITLILTQAILLSIVMKNHSVQENKLLNYELSDINHIIHLGQSLAAGEQSLPIVTDSTTGFGNFKFAFGTHTWNNNYYPDQPELRDMKNFSFVPLTAQQRGAEGETIANGICDHLTQTIGNLFHIDARFLFSYSGQGGRYLRELDKRHDDAKDQRAGNRRSGGGYYKTSIDDVKKAKKVADSMQLSYSVFAITWMQGEAEESGKVNRWNSAYERDEFINIYKKDLINLKNDYQSDIGKITGGKNKIPFFTYQTAGAMSGTAQLLASDEEKDMFMIGPTYMLPNAENGYYYSRNKLVHGDGIHLTADGERWLGEQFGKVMRKVIIEGKDWQPLRPLKAWYNENDKAVYIRYHVPEPPIVIDTTFLPRQDKGLGFDIYDNENRKYSIEKVDVIGKDVVRVSLTKVLDADVPFFISYGLLSKVADLSCTIKSINLNVSRQDSHDSIEIVFDGNILDEVTILNNEGVFYLNNIVKSNEDFTNLIVREVFLDENGNTVFSGVVEDLKNNIHFRPGQKCYTSRRYTFGNIRDSDMEKSTFRFKDNTYGTRHGQYYPLYNWSIAFQNLPVEKN